jgi:hypothetical protein
MWTASWSRLGSETVLRLTAVALAGMVTLVSTQILSQRVRAAEEESRAWARRAAAYSELARAAGDASQANAVKTAILAARHELALSGEWSFHPLVEPVAEANAFVEPERALIEMAAVARVLELVVAREAAFLVTAQQGVAFGGCLVVACLLGVVIVSRARRTYACDHHEQHPAARTLEVEIWEPRPVRTRYVHAVE